MKNNFGHLYYKLSTLKYLYGIIQNLDPVFLIDMLHHLGKDSIGKFLIIRYHRYPHGGSLPKIVMSHLRHGDVEFIPQPIFYPLQKMSFAFQGSAFWNMNVDVCQSHHHVKTSLEFRV
jgi:hypothetical protein